MLLFVCFFVCFFLRDLFCRDPLRCRTRETYASTEGWARSEPGQTWTVCKAQQQFSELKKASPEGSRAETLPTFPERKLRSPPTASFSPRTWTPAATRVFFPAWPAPGVAPRHLSICCGKKRGRRLPAPSAAGEARGQENVRGSGEEARGMARGGGASISSPPVEQKPLYFLP